MNTYLGVDIGGTNVRYGLVDHQGKILSDSHFLIRAQRGKDAVIEDLLKHLKNFITAVPSEVYPRGAAVGVAGQIRPKEGLVVFSPNLPGWENVPIGAIISESLGLEVRIENDANMYALGEWLAGVGQGMDNLIVLTLGTGVGGGLILDRKIRQGMFGTAGEIGHTVVNPDGRECPCGGRGCLETISSAKSMARLAREALENGKKSSYEGDPELLTSVDLFELAINNDSLALDVFNQAGSAIGVALANVFNLLGIEGAVIGGGAGQTFEFIKPAIISELSTRVFAIDPTQIILKRSRLGDMAPLIGAPILFSDNNPAA